LQGVRKNERPGIREEASREESQEGKGERRKGSGVGDQGSGKQVKGLRTRKIWWGTYTGTAATEPQNHFADGDREAGWNE